MRITIKVDFLQEIKENWSISRLERVYLEHNMGFLSKYWWVFVTRALLLLVIGVIAVTAPHMPLETLVFYLGFLSLAMLILSVMLASLWSKDKRRWLPFGLFVLFDAVLAYFCLLKTSLASQVFVAAVSVWALLMGLGLLRMSITQKGMGRIILLLNCVLSFVFAGFVFFNPLKTTSVNFMIGFYTLLFSLFLLYLSYRLFSLGSKRQGLKQLDQANK